MKSALVCQRSEFGIRGRRPEQIREPRGKLVIVQSNNRLFRHGVLDGRDEEKLGRDENRLQYHAESRLVVHLMVTSKIKDIHQNVQFTVRRRTAIGLPRQSACDLSGGILVFVWIGRCFSEELFLDFGRWHARCRNHLLHHLVGELEEYFRLKRRDGIQKPLTFHLVGQATSNRWIDTEEIVDRVTVLGPVQTTHDVLPRIHRCQVL